MLAYMKYENGLKFQNVVFENENVAKVWLKQHNVTNPDCYKLVEVEFVKEEPKARIRTAEDYLFEEMGIKMPEDEIPGSWFFKHDLPMIVECSCCGMTTALPSAMVGDDGTIYCSSCAGE